MDTIKLKFAIVQDFIKAVNTAGIRMNSVQLLEEVMGELPKAMQKTSLMFGSLAVRETTSPLPM